ncbi:hypothetical protein ABT168_16720 [Streptomyces sp. NPDC001793]|uniref:hypothetical protein n=1 Tax=Streptomyces sp. NPDC001793 TaxID=3154657 RepID=UPI00332B09DA
MAAQHANNALQAANRTKEEAEGAVREAAMARLQSTIAVQASGAARNTAAGIADPANTAIELTAPFAGKDVDADFAAEVAKAAQETGEEQVKAAEAKAAEAVKAAEAAEAAAKRAGAQVAPAFKAAAEAARSSANAARSAAAAMKSAAEAAVDGAKARAAAASANKADAQAKGDAALARQAANQAAADAAAARKAANEAEAEAARARKAAAEADQHAAAANSAANQAEHEASVAQGAAAQAEKDAADAGKLADSAENHAKSAEEAAENAEKYAKEADEAAKRAEEYRREQERKARGEAARKIEGRDSELTSEEEQALKDLGLSPEEFERIRELSGKDLLDYLKENGGEILVELFFEDIKKCYDDPDIPTCLWAIVQNIGPGKAAKIVQKLPKIGKAIWGINKFLDKVDAARKKIDKYEDALEKAWKKLPACVKEEKKKRPVVRGAAFTSGGTNRSFVLMAGGKGAGDLGLKREEFIAKLVGGKVAKDSKGQDIRIEMPNVGSSGLDVIGPNGEYIYVGGGAKAKNPSKFGTALKVNKYAADQAGVKAIYYLADNTPEAAIKQAKKVFGEENVHIFILPSC